MKIRTLYLLPAALLMAGTIASCSDDDPAPVPEPTRHPGNVNPTAVFSNGMPAQAGGYAIATDAKGLVETMTDAYGDSIVYTYPAMEGDTEAINAGRDVIISYYTGGSHHYDIVCELNEVGYIMGATTVYADTQSDLPKETWAIDYNTDNTISKLTYTSGSNVTTTAVSYTDGDIVKTEAKAAGGTVTRQIIYTDTDNPTAIDNRGNVMLLSQTFGIGIGKLGMAYYAGLLGKATKHLPIAMISSESADDVHIFDWKLSATGMPEEMTENYSSYKFVW